MPIGQYAERAGGSRWGEFSLRGSLQEWADDTYGDGVVVVLGQLVDA